MRDLHRPPALSDPRRHAGHRRWLELSQVILVLDQVAHQEQRLTELRAQVDRLGEEIETLDQRWRGEEAALSELERHAEERSTGLEALQAEERELAQEMTRVGRLAERWRQVQRLQQRLQEERVRWAGFAADLEVQAADAERQVLVLEEGRAALPWLRQVRERRSQRNEELRRAGERAVALAECDAGLRSAQERLMEVERRLAEARDQEKGLIAERSKAEAQRQQAEGRLARFAQAAQERACELCGQEISAAHAAKEQDRLRAEIGQIEVQSAESLSGLRACEAQRQALEREEPGLRKACSALQRERDKAESVLRLGQETAERLLRELEKAAAHLPAFLRRRLGDLAAEGGYPGEEDLALLQAEVAQLMQVVDGARALRQQVAERRLCQQGMERDDQELAEILARAQAGELEQAAQRETEVARRKEALEQDRQARSTELNGTKDQIRKARERVARMERARQEKERERGQRLADQRDGEGERRATLSQVPAAWRERGLALGEDGLRELRAEAQGLARYEVLHRELQEAEQSGLAERIAALARQIEGVPDRGRRAQAAVVQEQAAIEGQLRQAQVTLTERTDALGKLRTAQQQRLEVQTRRDQVAEEHALHDRLARALGPKGLQRWLLQQAEQGIVAQANETLHDLTNGRLWLKLQTDEDSKKALDLLVCNQQTSDRPMPIALCSGSQRFRIAISLALATGRYLSREARRVESVIIDEGFGCLDRESRSDTVEVLKALKDQLARIILVSHQEEFTSSFTQGYRIELRDRSSTAIPLLVSTV